MLRMETSGEPSLSALLASAPSSHRGHVGLILIEAKLYETEIRRDHAGPRAGCGIAMDGRARCQTQHYLQMPVVFAKLSANMATLCANGSASLCGELRGGRELGTNMSRSKSTL